MKKVIINKFKVKKLELAEELKKKNSFRVAIFGSARIKKEDKAYQQVFDLAKLVGANGYDMITGGGPGMMEAANAGHMEGDIKQLSESIGLVIKLPWENKGNPYLEVQHRYKHFSARLDTFLALSNVMVVTKGGIGSLLELYYMWQHLQVHLSPYKPIILIGKMWETLIDWMKKETLPDNLVSTADFDYIYIAHSNKEAMEIIERFHELYQDENSMRKITCNGTRCVIPPKPKSIKAPAKDLNKKMVAKKQVSKIKIVKILKKSATKA